MSSPKPSPQPWICLTGSLTSRHARATTSPSSRRWEPLRLRSRSSSSLDYDFSVDDLARGLYPKVPIYPHLTEVEVPEEFRIIYHYTSWSSLQAIICTRIFPGASSCKGHVYMTRHAPWEIDGKDPGVRTLCLAIDTGCALHYGIRLVETLAGALICEDWIPNHCLIYAFDCEKSQYLWANHGYNGVKKYLRQKASENALTWKENEARKGTPDYEVLERHEASDLQALKDLFTDQYPQWKDVVTLAQAFDFQGSQHAVRNRRWASSKTKAATSQLQEHPLCCSEAHRLSCRLWCCPRQRAGTPFWSLWPGGIRSCRGGEAYALAVCVDFGNAGADLPQVPEDFPGGHADLSGLWSFSCHYVGHETRLPNLQTWGVGWEARLRAHPGHAGGRWRCRHNAGIQADPFCRRSPEEPCAILHEAGAQGRNVIAPASGNGRPLRFQLCGSGPHAEVHALDYSARQCGASEHQARKRRNSYWKSTPIQSTHVHRRAGARTDANIGCRRPCFILVQESLLPRQSLCGGVRGPPDPGPVRSSQRREHHLPVACTDQAGCLRWHPQLRAQHSSASHRSCWYGRRKPTPPCDQADEPGLHQVYQAWVWFSSRSNSRLHTAGVERFLQPVDRSGVGRLASSKPRPSVPRSSVRPRLSLRHRGAEALAWCVSITRGGMASFWKRCRKAEAFAYWDLIRGRWFASLQGWVRDSTNIQTCVC